MSRLAKADHINRLIIVSDSTLLDQRRAHRSAYLAMIDHLAEQSGAPSALVAQALRGIDQPPPVIGGVPAMAAGDDRSKLHADATQAVSHYLVERAAATRPPPGLIDTFADLRRTFRDRDDGRGQAIVGLSSLSPPALRQFLDDDHIRQVFDTIYSAPSGPLVGQAPGTGLGAPWIVQLDAAPPWPSGGSLEAICALRQVPPAETLFIGSRLNEEVGPALNLGMRAVYVRLGLVQEGSPAVLDPASSAPTVTRRPDAIVTRVQDLLHLPLFDGPTDGNGSKAPSRPFTHKDRDR